MLRYLVGAALLAGCASGHAPETGDGPAASDAKEYFDAPSHGEFQDASPDAPRDAFVPKDAPADAACVPQVTELLTNPTFDLTPLGTGWTQVPIETAYPPITSDGVTPQSAPYMAWMGGFTGDDEGVSTVTDQVYQNFTVPAGTTQLTITGYYIVGTQETTTTTAYDHGTLDVIQTNGTPIEGVIAATNLTNTGATWLAFSHTFTTNLSGQTVRLRLTTTNDVTLATSFYFDSLALNATHCP